MRATHALCAAVIAGAALLGGDPVAQAQATAATTAATAAAPKRGTFMRIQGMNGAASDSQHAGWIELSSFQWGVGRNITGASGAAADRAGRPSVSEITVTKPVDASSPKLALASAQGKHFPEVVIDFVRPDKQVLYQVKLQDVIISRIAMSSGGDRPQESVTLNFTKIEWTYSNQSANGTTGAPQAPPATWDVVRVTQS